MIAGTTEDLRNVADTITVESEKMEIGLNVKETETMVVSKKTVIPKAWVMLNGTLLNRHMGSNTSERA